MANRGCWGALGYILRDEALIHALFILGLFLYVTIEWERSDVQWIEDGLLGRNKDPQYASFKTAYDVLRWETVAFFIIFVLPLYHGAKNARLRDPELRVGDPESQARVRDEESDTPRGKAYAAMCFQIAVSILVILCSLLNAHTLQRRQQHHQQHHHDPDRFFVQGS